MTTAQTVLVDDADGVRTITLNRPEARNALDQQMAAELQAALDDTVAAGTDIRVTVLRGAGGVFCAGGDLKGFKDAFSGTMSRADIAAMNLAGGRFFDAWASLGCVTVAAVEKAAMGGGVGLAAMADVTIATADTRFSTTETTLGLIPAQIASHLVDRLGRHEARKLMIGGRRITADDARAIGLVDRVVADAAALDEAIAAVVADVRRTAPSANAVTKRLIDRAAHGPRAGYAQEAAELFADALLGEEAKAGLTAFVTRQRPPWDPEPTEDEHDEGQQR